MKVLSQTCVNSKWIARFFAMPHEECCECFGQCKVRVQSDRGHTYILTEEEMDRLKEHERHNTGIKPPPKAVGLE